MKVLGIQRIVFSVNDTDEAVKFWTELLGLEFPPRSHDPQRIREYGEVTHTYSEWATESEKARPVAAVSTLGLELMHKDPMPGPEGMHWLILTVDNMEEAKAHMQAKGIRWVHEIKVGNVFNEVFYHPDDLHGVRLVLASDRKAIGM